MARLGAVALSVLIASSCGDEGLTLEDFPARAAAAHCARVFRCCSESQIRALYGSAAASESKCVFDLTGTGQTLANQIAVAQSSGRLRYDGVAAAHCFQKMRTAACTATSNDWSDIPECDAFTVPLVATGGACASDQECRTGSCDRSFLATGDGTCAVVPGKGMACTTRCVPGSTCDTVTAVCVAPKPEGSACLVDDDCVSGNCDNPSITDGICAAPAGPTCGPG